MSCNTFPDCPAGEAAKDQFKQHVDVSKKLSELAQDQKALITGVSKIELLLAEFKHITSELMDLREQSRKAFNELFERMRTTEQKVGVIESESDTRANDIATLRAALQTMQQTGLGWLWRVAELAIVGIVSFLVTGTAQQLFK